MILYAAVAQGLVWGVGTSAEHARRDAMTISSSGEMHVPIPTTFSYHIISVEQCKRICNGAVVWREIEAA